MMKLYTNNISTISKYILIDNDFLNELFWDNDIFNDFLSSFKESIPLIDPLTEFEFLRDVFEPKQRRIKKAFIAQSIFSLIYDTQEDSVKLRENAMLLSIIYSHQGHNKNTKISLVDLFLGSRCMLNASSMCLITGNKKDFPNSIYDISTIINIEQNDGSIKPYSFLKFSIDKFGNCYKEMQKMEAKYNKSSE
jgi:hypothetical protein